MLWSQTKCKLSTLFYIPDSVMNIKNSGLNKQYLVSDTILFQLWQEEIIFLLQKILLIPILREYLIP